MTDVIVRETVSPLALMQTAVEKGFDTEQLKVLFELHNKHNDNLARQAFAAAVCNVQQRIIAVMRNKENPQTRSKYADLEAIDKMLRPIYTDEGLALKFSEIDCPLEGNMRVQLTVLHRMGHTDESTIDLPMDGTGLKGQANKTATHAKASTFTYGQRYLTVAYFNIPLARDDDGNGGKRQQAEAVDPNTALRTKTLPELEKAAAQGVEALRAYWKGGKVSPAAQKACYDDWPILRKIAEEADARKEGGHAAP